MANNELNMFNIAKIKFNDLYDSAISYLRRIYGNVGQYFTDSSPFGQLLKVTLHLGRMIMVYIEDAITELNIKTATREKSIKGLAALTGHNPSRGLAARGSVKFSYNNSNEYTNQFVIIPNYTQLKNNSNGLIYTMVLPSDNMKMLLSSSSTYSNVSIVQGELKYQQATGTGEGLQSFNFNINPTSSGFIDQYFVNIYVNGEKWKNVDSILDMSLDEKACIIKTGQTGGVDVFFGTGANGAIPPQGSIILFEYLFTQGYAGNINNLYQSNNINWEFVGNGYLEDGENVDLNSLINISLETAVIFGTDEENLLMTKLLAPHASRSFVLANKSNYEYFLRRLNMFSVIDVISGFNTHNDIQAIAKYNIAESNFNIAKKNYDAQVQLTGINSDDSKKLYAELISAKNILAGALKTYKYAKSDDNTIYLFLIPDITLRINDNENYFTCNPDSFYLTDDEKTGILDLIKSSGQQIITMDNKILDPKIPRFAINCFIQMWENYEFEVVKSSIISAVSDYLIANTRRDRIPVSDLISVIEKVKGVDSVTVMFDADKNNTNIYTNSCGIDEFGDILLEREFIDAFNEKVKVNDILPLFRGGFYNTDGIYYSDTIDNSELGPINISLRGISKINSINKIDIY